jgi:uncharacterized membrane protein YkvA (DUF1232 family)
VIADTLTAQSIPRGLRVFVFPIIAGASPAELRRYIEFHPMAASGLDERPGALTRQEIRAIFSIRRMVFLIMTNSDQKIVPISRGGKRNVERTCLKEAVLLLPRLVRLLYRLVRDPRVSRTNKVLVGAAVAYVLSPIDIVPDFIPLAGQVDDLFAVCIVLMRLIADTGEDVITEHWTGSENLILWIHDVARISKLFLPDRVVSALNERFG